MSEPRRTNAGTAFERALKVDPAARAAWERASKRLVVLARAFDEVGSLSSATREQASQEFAMAVREALCETDRELEAAQFEPPRTIDEWEHLAHLVEMPFETIRSGTFTLADVRAVALAWVDRQRMKARLAGGSGSSSEPAQAQTKVERGAPDIDEAPPPALTRSEVSVLRALAAFDPSELASNARIVAAMDLHARLSERAAGPIVHRLIEIGLAERPQGPRSGSRLTLRGRRVARNIAD